MLGALLVLCAGGQHRHRAAGGLGPGRAQAGPAGQPGRHQQEEGGAQHAPVPPEPARPSRSARRPAHRTDCTAVGDSAGAVHTLKLSPNLRTQEEQIQKAAKEGNKQLVKNLEMKKLEKLLE